jgi:hypothetical protein
MDTPEICPACGAEVPRNAIACPECGADENTGWNEEASRLDGLGLPDDDEFDHDKFIETEFGGRSSDANWWPIWIVAAVAVIILVLAILFGIVR